MTKIVRSRDLSLLNLSIRDLDGRIGIMVGWAKGELKPPGQIISPTELSDLISYSNERPTFRRAYDVPKIEKLDPNLPRVVEVMGAVIQCCVGNQVYNLLDHDKIVYVDPRFVYSGHGRFNPFWKGRILLQYLLSGQGNEACLVYHGKFLFYRTDKIN